MHDQRVALGLAVVLLVLKSAIGTVSAQTLSTQGAAGYTTSTFISDGTLKSPTSVEVDALGNVYVVDSGNFVVRRYTSSGSGKILAGTLGTNQKNPPSTVPLASRVSGVCYTQTGNHCLGTQAILSNPRDVAIDSAGHVYISDISAGKIRKLNAKTGIMEHFSGGNKAGWSPSSFHAPAGITMDSSGNLYVADKVNNAVRKVSHAVSPAKGFIVTTLAGLGPDNPGCSAEGALATSAALTRPQDVAVDAAGNIYIADTGCRKIRVITKDGTIHTLVGTGADHTGNPPEVPFTASSGSAQSINLANPIGIAVDSLGNLIIADPGFDIVWFYSSSTGTIQVLAGLAPGVSVCSNSTNPQGDGCRPDGAFLNAPGKPAIDVAGNIYIPEQGGTKSPTHPFDVRVLRPVPQ
jgi:hypothetical protein